MSPPPDDPSGADGGFRGPPARADSWRTRRQAQPRAPLGAEHTAGGTAAAPATARASWRGDRDPSRQGTSWSLWLRRVALTVAAAALVLLLVRMLLTVHRPVPIVAASITTYRPPLAIIPQAGENHLLLAGLESSGRSFLPGSAVLHDVGPALASATADELLEGLVSALQRSKPGGPDGNMAIVYLTAIGTLDDKGHPCIVAPGNADDPTGASDDSFLRVQRLLAGLREALPERVGILVVLDACGPSNRWPLGVDDGAFTPAVETLMAGSSWKRLWVMVPAATGQIAYASRAQGGSGAMLEFARGIRGAADASPWGDADGRVELGELAAYLGERVDHWARNLLGDRQTPVLLGPAAVRSGDAAIAWTFSRTPAVEFRPQGGQESDEWLVERWRAAERLRPSATRERPLLWSHYLEQLMRAEAIRSAGHAFRGQQIDVDTSVQRMEAALSLPLIFNARLVPGIRLAYRSRNAVAVRDEAELQRWMAAVERYVGLDQPLDPALKPPAGVEDVDGWIIRAEAAWNWLVAKCEAGAAIDRTAVMRWLDCVGGRPEGPAFNPAQLHLMRMLTRCADPADWKADPGAFRDLIRLVSRSRESIYTQDVRADRIEGAEELFRRGDIAMRAALDLVFVGGAANLAKASALAREGVEAFDQRLSLSGRKLKVLELLDTVRADLPFLVAWWVEESRHAARVQADLDSGGLRRKPADIVALLMAVERLEIAMDAMDVVGDGQRGTGASIDNVDEVRTDCETLFTALKSAYLEDCADLATQAPESPRTLGRIRRVLAVPLVLGDLRVQLLRRADDLDRRHAALAARQPNATDEPLPPAEPSAAVAGWIPWRNQLTHPLLPVLRSESSGTAAPPKSAADIAADVGRQAAAARTAARSLHVLVADLDRQRAELSVGNGESDARTLELLASASRLSRRLAAVSGYGGSINESVTPTRRYFAVAWHQRLLRHAETTLDEFWGGVEPDEPVYCFHKARVLLESAAEIIRSNGVAFGDLDRGRISSRIGALAAQGSVFADLEVAPNRLILPSARDVEPTPNRVLLSTRPGVPEGLAAIWLSESLAGDPLHLLRAEPTGPAPGAAVRGIASRAPARVASPPEESSWRLDPTAAQAIEANRTAVLDMTAWYRGHRIVVGLPVAAAATSRTTMWEAPAPIPPRVTVRGDLPQAQSVAIIFDCSGSMGQHLADGRTRLDAGRAAVTDLLSGLSKTGQWDVSLWLYGHRTRWSRDKQGKYVAGFTPAGAAAKTRAERAGEPFTLVPGDDVEQVLPMQALTPAAAERIGMILAPVEPGGETPLYLAISEAIRTDFDGGRTDLPGHVLVVTDGANDQTGGRFVTAAAVEDQLARKNGRRRVPLRVDVVGFGFAPNGMDRASRMDDVRNLATGSGGRYYEAANADSLADSLRASLRVMRWQLRGADGPAETAALGSSLPLPVPLGGRPRSYEAVLDSGSSPPRRRFEVEGGEALDLHVVGGGRRLEFRRYDGGTEQGLRDSRTNLVDPSDPRRAVFIGAHLASRAGDAVRFPLSVQNAEATEFSPRPVEGWIEVAPRSSAGAVGGPFVFYDLAYQPNRPVPVLDLLATRWPNSADQAEIRAWLRFTPTPPDIAVTLADLPPGVERRLEMASLPGSEIRVTLAPAEAADRVQVSVLETHPATLADRLPSLRVAVTPDCLRATHVLEPETGRVRHEFTVQARGGHVSADNQLLITDKQRILAGAISVTASGDAPLTVGVPLPAE
ncbi:MAG: vWA domain-containing protein [Planctomycetota bacterium]